MPLLPPNPSQETPLLKKARQVALAVAERGGRALLVGGFVRDELLGLAPKDGDIEVYGLEPPVLRETLSKLGRVGAVGESFRVYKLVWHQGGERHELDVSIPRRDHKVGAGHRGFEVEGDPYATVEDAARRRDFTINAILRDPLTGEILDPFGGRADLTARLLRVVDAHHFAEDSLRVLRAIQFAARFELQIDPATAELCRSVPLDDLPSERIWGEWEKWLLRAERPSYGLWAGQDLGVFERIYPPLAAAVHRSGPVMASALDAAVAQSEGLVAPLRLALMLAVLGSHLGARATDGLLTILNVHKMRAEGRGYDVRQKTLQLVTVRKSIPDFHRRAPVADRELRFFSARIEPRLALRLARSRGQMDASIWFESEMTRLGVLDGPPEPWILGRHLLELGASPGPRVGEIVSAIYLRQLAGELEDPAAALAAAGELLRETP